MKDRTIADLADELADEFHKGQFRKDGKMYITHPRAVRDAAKFCYDPTIDYGSGLPLGEELPAIESVCLLHDVLEDCGVTVAQIRARLMKEFSILIVDPIIASLVVLNKNNYKSYRDYIVGILRSGDKMAHVGKTLDLKHNSSDLKSGSLKDKYDLSLFILELHV